MIDLKIDISDVLAKLARLNDADLARVIADAVVDEAVLPELAKYPAPSRAPQPFVSAKQRRYFFAALKEGSITVPYPRTGGLGKSFTKAPFGGGVNVTSTLGYADLVVGEKQARYFKGNWPSVTDVAAKIEKDTAEVIATAKVLERLQEAGLL